MHCRIVLIARTSSASAFERNGNAEQTTVVQVRGPAQPVARGTGQHTGLTDLSEVQGKRSKGFTNTDVKFKVRCRLVRRLLSLIRRLPVFFLPLLFGLFV